MKPQSNNLLAEIQSAKASRLLRHVSNEDTDKKEGACHNISNELKSSNGSSNNTTSFGTSSRLQKSQKNTSTNEVSNPLSTNHSSTHIVESVNPIATVGSDGWEERFTVDDVPYYYNTKLDTLSWDKPDCLLSEKEKQEGKRKWVWIENEEDGWIPLCVVVIHIVSHA